jgi:outer membrane protein
MKLDVAQQKALLDIQKGKLASSLGLDADTPLELAAVDKLPAPQQCQTSDLISLAKQQRTDLMAKRARVAESYERQKKVRASYGPKLSLGGRGAAEHFIHDHSNGGHYQIGLNLDMPLFTGFDASYQNRLAYADTQISMEQLAQLELDIALEVLTHSRSLEAAQEMLCYAEENLFNAQKAYDGTLDKYKAGKERIGEVSIALRQLASARTRFSDVKTRWLVSMANLAYATGSLLPNMENTCEQSP